MNRHGDMSERVRERLLSNAKQSQELNKIVKFLVKDHPNEGDFNFLAAMKQCANLIMDVNVSKNETNTEPLEAFNDLIVSSLK